MHKVNIEMDEHMYEESIEELEKSVDLINKETDKKMDLKKYSSDPEIYTIDNYLTSDECKHMINISEGKFTKSLVSGKTKGYVSEGRTGLNCWIPHNTDSITYNIGKKISELVGIPLENSEAFQMIYYDVNQEYRQHYDSWDFDGSDKSRRNTKYGGQRMVTALCYLNTVEEGGGTNFPRLNIQVGAIKGRVLVFHNVLGGTNKRHILSEHAGMPVIKGYKIAFNLWFREISRKKLYNYQIDTKFLNISNNTSITKKNTGLENKIVPIKDFIIHAIDQTNNIYFIENFINKIEIDNIVKNSNFNNDQRSKFWINNNNIKFLIVKLEELLQIKSEYFENICVVKYRGKEIHNNHFDAFNLNSENGIKNTSKLGQRLITITGSLINPVTFEFTQLNKSHFLNEGSILIYKNTKESTNIRNENISKKIVSNDSIIFNIYVREKNASGNQMIIKDNLFDNKLILLNETKEDPKLKDIALKSSTYKNTLEIVYDKIKNKEKIYKGYADMQFNGKTPWDEITIIVNKLYNIRIENNNSLLNLENINKNYKQDELTPVIVENVFLSSVSDIFKDYITNCIQNNRFLLGDKQSNRYKANNETISRILHYELLPLIEKIVNKKLRPTYTYLACYKKNTDLPPHTDRPDCEYTVSFIIDKPINSSWNIYFHKTKQKEKGKGRYYFKPDKSECIGLDSNRNGLMLFQGEDHVHFREKLELEYYNILLLHYKV